MRRWTGLQIRMSYIRVYGQGHSTKTRQHNTHLLRAEKVAPLKVWVSVDRAELGAHFSNESSEVLLQLSSQRRQLILTRSRLQPVSDRARRRTHHCHVDSS